MPPTSKTLLTRVSIVSLLLLAAVGLTWHAISVSVPSIEADLVQRSRAALGYAGLESLEVSADGRDITLKGALRDAYQNETAIATLSSIWGIRKIHDLTFIGGDPSVPGSSRSAKEYITRCQSLLDEKLVNRKVTFTPGSEIPEKSAENILREIALIAAQCPDAQLVITGHTDNIGDAEANLALSEKRADAVAGVLQQFGLDRFRVRTVGKGESEPIADNNTATGRERNRRMEFRFDQPRQGNES